MDGLSIGTAEAGLSQVEPGLSSSSPLAQAPSVVRSPITDGFMEVTLCRLEMDNKLRRGGKRGSR